MTINFRNVKLENLRVKSFVTQIPVTRPKLDLKGGCGTGRDFCSYPPLCGPANQDT